MDGITDVDRSLLTVKGNDFGGLEWTSKILMDERFPRFGSGHYHYLSAHKSDRGFLTIQIAENGEMVLVQVKNISGQFADRKSSRYVCAMVSKF